MPGRTDAGVHASGQVASVATAATSSRAASCAGLAAPAAAATDVRRSARRRPRRFDARRDARSRRYEYRVLPGPPSALRRARVLHHPAPLDPEAMADAARRAVGRHDFRAFTPTRTEHVFFDRTVTVCEWARRGDELVLTVEADAFLRHMVRVLAVAGTFLLVGAGARRDAPPAPPLPRSHPLARGAAGATTPSSPPGPPRRRRVEPGRPRARYSRSVGVAYDRARHPRSAPPIDATGPPASTPR